jgi:hypothetical protein
LKFSGIADDVFARIRLRVDSAIGTTVPEAVKKLTAIYENLRSDNPEDWSNAVHGCRRFLQDLADAVFPATDSTRTRHVGEKTITKAWERQHINRLLAKAAQKGSHSDIVRKEEADRYVVYTYLLSGGHSVSPKRLETI